MSTYVINTIFIVERTVGKWEDRETIAVKAAHCRDIAELYIAEQMAAQQASIDFEEALRMHYDAWNKATPEADMEPILDYRRWGSGLPSSAISQEMRVERNRILEENQRIQQRNTAKMDAREALWRAEYQRYVTDLGRDPASHEAHPRSIEPASFEINIIEVLANRW